MAVPGYSDGALGLMPDLRSQIEAVLVEQARQSATQISTLLSKALSEQSAKGQPARSASPRRVAPPSADRTSAWTKGFYDPAQSTEAKDAGELPTTSTDSIIPGANDLGKVDYRMILFDAMKMRDKCHSIMVEAKEAQAANLAAKIARPVPMNRQVSGEEQATAILRSASSITARRRERGIDSQTVAAQREPQTRSAATKEPDADIPGQPPTVAPSAAASAPPAAPSSASSAPPVAPSAAPSVPPTEKDEDLQARQVVEVLNATGVIGSPKSKPSAKDRWEHATRMAERNASLQRTLNELMADLERAKVIRETTSSSLSPPRQRPPEKDGVQA
mmetsp:Transcript_11060/g.20101  ORF Transcript_11060/g.20101 Transcript_11060/m.20101 type:complete len:333 (+) Transcript_11060:50-1048(+)